MAQEQAGITITVTDEASARIKDISDALDNLQRKAKESGRSVEEATKKQSEESEKHGQVIRKHIEAWGGIGGTIRTGVTEGLRGLNALDIALGPVTKSLAAGAEFGKSFAISMGLTGTAIGGFVAATAAAAGGMHMLARSFSDAYQKAQLFRDMMGTPNREMIERMVEARKQIGMTEEEARQSVLSVQSLVQDAYRGANSTMSQIARSMGPGWQRMANDITNMITVRHKSIDEAREAFLDYIAAQEDPRVKEAAIKAFHIPPEEIYNRRQIKEAQQAVVVATDELDEAQKRLNETTKQTSIAFQQLRGHIWNAIGPTALNLLNAFEAGLGATIKLIDDIITKKKELTPLERGYLEGGPPLNLPAPPKTDPSRDPVNRAWNWLFGPNKAPAQQGTPQRFGGDGANLDVISEESKAALIKKIMTPENIARGGRHIQDIRAQSEAIQAFPSDTQMANAVLSNIPGIGAAMRGAQWTRTMISGLRGRDTSRGGAQFFGGGDLAAQLGIGNIPGARVGQPGQPGARLPGQPGQALDQYGQPVAATQAAQSQQQMANESRQSTDYLREIRDVMQWLKDKLGGGPGARPGGAAPGVNPAGGPTPGDVFGGMPGQYGAAAGGGYGGMPGQYGGGGGGFGRRTGAPWFGGTAGRGAGGGGYPDMPQGRAGSGQDFYNQALAQVKASGLVGQVPPDGRQFGITTGSAEEWARFMTGVAKAESNFNPRSTNTSDPGGSFGVLQYAHNQVPGGNAYDTSASISAFIRDAQQAMRSGGIRSPGSLLRQRFSTIGSHPERTIRNLVNYGAAGGVAGQGQGGYGGDGVAVSGRVGTTGGSAPGYVSGTVSLGGQMFHWGSGGGGAGSIPSGTFPINIGDIGDVGRRIGSIAGLGGPGGTIWDPRLGRNRAGIQIHPNTHGSDLDRLYTAGCFSIPQNEWPAFRNLLLSEARKHPEGLFLNVNRNGQAVIGPRGQQQQQVAGGPPRGVSGAGYRGGPAGPPGLGIPISHRRDGASYGGYGGGHGGGGVVDPRTGQVFGGGDGGDGRGRGGGGGQGGQPLYFAGGGDAAGGGIEIAGRPGDRTTAFQIQHHYRGIVDAMQKSEQTIQRFGGEFEPRTPSGVPLHRAVGREAARIGAATERQARAAERRATESERRQAGEAAPLGAAPPSEDTTHAKAINDDLRAQRREHARRGGGEGVGIGLVGEPRTEAQRKMSKDRAENLRRLTRERPDAHAGKTDEDEQRDLDESLRRFRQRKGLEEPVEPLSPMALRDPRVRRQEEEARRRRREGQASLRRAEEEGHLASGPEWAHGLAARRRAERERGARLDVNVSAPKGTRVKTDGGDVFKDVKTRQVPQMARSDNQQWEE